MAAAGLPDQARLAFRGRADASLDELLPRCTIKRRAEDFVVDEVDEDGQRASEAMTRAPEATLKPALEDLAAKLDSRQQQPAAEANESDGEDALATLGEATLDALRAFDAAAKDQVLRDGVGASPISVALPDGGNRLNLRLALEKGFPWTRVRLESGVVEADLRLKPLATILSADDVERLQRFGRTRGSKATATIEAPADKDARRAVHTTLAAAFRACETKTLDAVWKSTSELGSTPSSRRGHGDDVASMAWGARNLISTQARRGHDLGAVARRPQAAARRPALAARREVRPGKAQCRGLRGH